MGCKHREIVPQLQLRGEPDRPKPSDPYWTWCLNEMQLFGEHDHPHIGFTVLWQTLIIGMITIVKALHHLQ